MIRRQERSDRISESRVQEYLPDNQPSNSVPLPRLSVSRLEECASLLVSICDWCQTIAPRQIITHTPAIREPRDLPILADMSSCLEVDSVTITARCPPHRSTSSGSLLKVPLPKTVRGIWASNVKLVIDMCLMGEWKEACEVDIGRAAILNPVSLGPRLEVFCRST